MTTSMRFFRSAWRCSESRMYGGMTRKSNSRSSVISLLGNSLLRDGRIWYAENMVIQLRQERDFEQLMDRSKTSTVLIFKHSTQCPISSQTYDKLTRFAKTAGAIDSGMCHVCKTRNVS